MTVVLIKPDAVEMGLTESIINRYTAAGLRVFRRGKYRMTPDQAKQFYAEHENRFYFAALILAMTSGPIEMLILHGENVVQQVREMNGATDPNKATAGTIRHDFRSAGGPFNTVHASDSLAAASREFDLLMKW
ncbi:MAG: nucleoside-diphosphate kinase [Candidatus Paceibacterota bacterium]|jgi:nucleoside-diphosphate kinase